ncbi:MAG: tail fiber domain-containing protein [Rudaea sp.]
MKHTLLFAALAAASIFSSGALRAAEFTYHGNLQDAGKPAEGTYDLELTLYSSPEGGKVVAGPLVMYKVPVHEGTFSTEADFGLLTHVTGPSWLGVAVRSAGKGDFAPLSARAPISAAETATNSSCPGSWSLDGNAGNPTGDYLGTADSQPLIVKVGNSQIARAFLGTSASVASWIGGGSQNSSVANVSGAFIGGGGSNSGTGGNSVGTYSVVGGGLGNTATGGSSVVGGGTTNTATGSGSFVGAGSINTASGPASVVCGGANNTASNFEATVGGGDHNTASGLYSTVGGGGGNTVANSNVASGDNSTVPGGKSNSAIGSGSFAAGVSATAHNNNSFVWSDGTPVGDNGPQQFDIRANGGVAINGFPENNGTELSIYPSSNGGNYSNLYYGLNGAGGILTSAGGASTATSNDASLYFDNYDGFAQTRIFTIAPVGITVGGIPFISEVAMLPQNSTANVVLTTVGSQLSDTTFGIFKKPTAGGTGVNFLQFGAAGELTIYNTSATKPGGGMWSAPSDRRIKQDIEPIHDAVDTLMKLRPVNFHYTPEFRAMEGGLADKSYEGFIAQEYAEVFPSDVIRTDKHVPGADKNDPTILELDSSSAVITTVAAVQELAVDNIALHQQIDELLARLNKLDAGKGR